MAPPTPPHPSAPTPPHPLGTAAAAAPAAAAAGRPQALTPASRARCLLLKQVMMAGVDATQGARQVEIVDAIEAQLEVGVGQRLGGSWRWVAVGLAGWMGSQSGVCLGARERRGGRAREREQWAGSAIAAAPRAHTPLSPLCDKRARTRLNGLHSAAAASSGQAAPSSPRYLRAAQWWLWWVVVVGAPPSGGCGGCALLHPRTCTGCWRRATTQRQRGGEPEGT